MRGATRGLGTQSGAGNFFCVFFFFFFFFFFSLSFNFTEVLPFTESAVYVRLSLTVAAIAAVTRPAALRVALHHRLAFRLPDAEPAHDNLT